MNLVSSLIADAPDWPKLGMVFEGITPLLASPKGSRQAADAVVASAPEVIDVVIGMEARGFIFTAPVVLAPRAGFVSVRKPGKLPHPMLSESFDLEYGTTTLIIHADTLVTGARALVVGDVFATGGTMTATAALLKRLGTELMYVSVLLELAALNGRERLADQGISSCSAVLTSQGHGQTEEADPQGVCHLDGEHAPPTGAAAA